MSWVLLSTILRSRVSRLCVRHRFPLIRRSRTRDIFPHTQEQAFTIHETVDFTMQSFAGEGEQLLMLVEHVVKLTCALRTSFGAHQQPNTYCRLNERLFVALRGSPRLAKYQFRLASDRRSVSRGLEQPIACSLGPGTRTLLRPNCTWCRSFNPPMLDQLFHQCITTWAVQSFSQVRLSLLSPYGPVASPLLFLSR